MKKPTGKSSVMDIDWDICNCPICASEEFLLSSDGDDLLCIECGVVPLKSESHTASSFSHLHRASVLH
ncbi:hypothetical protein [Vibrio rumoiensis]|uniref:hypothetical protein n=1 Tax=Vibrio rumoiensis TaxID=76258 RepID=UPI00114CF31C|nr:hypothetical protein [Vibrio rumoiensis]